MTGSCALNLCGIACGRLDLFYELGFGGPWYDIIVFTDVLVVSCDLNSVPLRMVLLFLSEVGLICD